MVSGKPAVLFGKLKKPGAQEELTYVLVFRVASPGVHGLPIDGLTSSTSGEGRKQVSRDAFTINGKRVEVKYEIELNETHTAVTRESLTVGGENKELAAGRVFLVDLDGKLPAYKQKSLNLSIRHREAQPIQSPT